jgi:hypothetical protein
MQNELLNQIINWVWLAPAGWVWSVLKKQTETVAQLDKDMAVLKQSAVDEEKVRAVVHEQLQPLREDMAELNTGMQGVTAIVQDIKVELARRENG